MLPSCRAQCGIDKLIFFADPNVVSLAVRWRLNTFGIGKRCPECRQHFNRAHVLYCGLLSNNMNLSEANFEAKTEEARANHIDGHYTIPDSLLNRRQYARFARCIYSSGSLRISRRKVVERSLSPRTTNKRPDPLRNTGFVAEQISQGNSTISRHSILLQTICKRLRNHSQPSNPTTRQECSFTWGDEQQTASYTLKERLTTAPILAQPIFS
ncbi:uncharacterized protein VTP21DRAFT_2574 [Calcarisporiella thermophila]|uniref:uncharacterized protein n=1 Tax=Calcarisporiella thermophila TaxID=911321 RepID=UPI0037448D85